MPKFVLDKLNKIQADQLKPIAIVKSEKGSKDPYHNMFLYLDSDDKPTDEKIKTKIEIPYHCKFEILPNTNPNKRDVYYIAGASGSGKSYICKQIVDNYCKLYPNRKIFIVSKLDEDETLDGIKSKNIIRLDYKDFVLNPPDINDKLFYESFVIFDDCDCIDKKQDKAINTFMNDIAVTGRKHKEGQGCISMAFISHYLSNYKKTRLILNEATNYVLYPQSTSNSQLYYLLNKYLGMKRDEIRELKKLGRWVCIHKNFPQYMISQYQARILNTD